MSSLQYDVHINPSLDDSSLVLIKFPAIKSQFEHDNIHLSVKPKNMRFKLDVLESKLQRSYSSTETTIEDDQLFVAKLVDGKLVCHPLSHILTMQCDLSHFDLKEEVDPTEEIKPIHFRFSAPDTINKAEIEEEFKTFGFKTAKSREAIFQRSLLYQVGVKPDPELADIKPKIEKIDVQSSPKKLNQIKKLVKDCLLKAKIVSFEEVYEFLNSPSNNKDILDALVDLALLVQGNWVIKSDILYGDSSEKSCTEVTGISINLFTNARDYLLWLFTQDRLVSRLEFSRKVKMPDHDVLELFKQLSVFRKDLRKWELKLPTDTRFMEGFPDVVQRQTQIWKVRRANKLSVFY